MTTVLESTSPSMIQETLPIYFVRHRRFTDLDAATLAASVLADLHSEPVQIETVEVAVPMTRAVVETVRPRHLGEFEIPKPRSLRAKPIVADAQIILGSQIVLTTMRAAAFLGVDEVTLLGWRSPGCSEGPTFILNGGQILYALLDLQSWQRSSTAEKRRSRDTQSLAVLDEFSRGAVADAVA